MASSKSNVLTGIIIALLGVSGFLGYKYSKLSTSNNQQFDEIAELQKFQAELDGEYQVALSSLENMKNDGLEFVPGEVTDWMDCGNKNATVDTNKRVLSHLSDEKLISDTSKTINATIIEPCYLGENVVIEDSTIGPHVSVGDNTTIKNSVISNSIIQTNTQIKNASFDNSMIGNFVEYDGKSNQLSISDYSTVKNN